MYINEYIELREIARKEQKWLLCDEIRNYLDKQHIFIFDTKDGQEVYYRTKGTRAELETEIKRDIQANKNFDSWLYSIKQSINEKTQKNK